MGDWRRILLRAWAGVTLSCLTFAGGPVRAQTLFGGNSEWRVVTNAGSSNSRPVGGFVNGSFPGMGILDAELAAPPQGDPFDYGQVFYLTSGASTGVYAPRTITLNPDASTATGDVVNLFGIDAQMQYAALSISGSEMLRTFVTLTNRGTTAQTVTASFATNLGSDFDTQLVATSSGDTTFTTADRWIVTDDDDLTDGDVASSFVFFGQGAPLTTSSVSQTVFSEFGTEGVLANFALTLGAGETRSLLLFNQMHGTAAEATAAAAFFDAPFPGDDLVVGLTRAQLATVANWAAVPVPEPSSVVLSVLGAGGVGLWLARRRVREHATRREPPSRVAR